MVDFGCVVVEVVVVGGGGILDCSSFNRKLNNCEEFLDAVTSVWIVAEIEEFAEFKFSIANTDFSTTLISFAVVLSLAW